MALLIITSSAIDRFVSALCNTLVHSLWQGLILAAVTGLIVLFTRKHSAAMRYNLLISALTLFAVGVAVTFAVQINEFKQTTTDAVTTINSVAANAAIKIDVPTPTQNFTDSLFSYLNQHHNTVVMVWFLIICAKSIQLVVGLMGVRRLKHTNVNQVTVDWYNRLQQLAHSLEIKKRVELLESGLAKVPMVIGALKPVILMPIGLLAALSIEEVEAILVHELAHIKRRDYLVNLLQSLMEIVFFFNPAVLWISQLIKAERENCCDDMALSQRSNKVSYIRALISCEEYQAAVPAYAMSFAGDKATLMSRVKRMVSNRNHTLNLFEKTVLAVCLVVSGLCLSAFGQKAQREYIANTVAKVIDNIQKQNATKSENKISDKIVVEKIETDKLAEQTLEAKDIPADSSKRKNMVARDEEGNTVYSLKDSGRLVPIDRHLTPVNVNLGPLHLDSKVNLNFTSKVTLNANPNANVNVDTPKNRNFNWQNKIHWQSKDGRKDTFVFKNEMKFNSGKIDPHKNVFGNRKNEISFTSTGDTTKKITLYKSKTELKHDQVVDGSGLFKLVNSAIKDPNNYKIELNNKELIVDGVKQSEDLHQLALKKYVKYPNDKVNVTIAVINH